MYITAVLSGSFNSASGSGEVLVSGILQNNGQILIGYYGQVGLLIDTGVLINSGTIGGSGSFIGTAGSTISVSGTLSNSGEISIGFGSYSGYHYDATGAQLSDFGIITNNGSILLEDFGLGNGSAPTLTVAGVLTNTDSILVQAAGLITVASGGRLTNQASAYLQGGYRIYDYESLVGGMGGVLSISGSMVNSGTLTLGGAYNPRKFFDHYGGFGATATVAGSLTNTGSLILNGGDGSYQVNFSPLFYGLGATLNVLGVLVNQSSIDVGSGKRAEYAQGDGRGARLVDSGQLINSGLLSIDGGSGLAAGAATVTASGTLTDTGSIVGAGTLVNQGVIISGGAGLYGGAISVAAFTNDATVSVAQGGTLSIDTAVSAGSFMKGVFDLSSYASLVLNGVINASQSIAFLGQDGTLGFAHAATFSGTLDGLAPGDTIDFLYQDVISATVNGTKLDVSFSTGGTADLSLGAPLTGDTLQLMSDGKTGTDLVVQGTASFPEGGGLFGPSAVRQTTTFPLPHLPAH